MSRFILNQNFQPTGEHEVHDLDRGCSYLPNPENRIPLGSHPSCKEAIQHARSKYPQTIVDGCAYCAPLCHTR